MPRRLEVAPKLGERASDKAVKVGMTLDERVEKGAGMAMLESMENVHNHPVVTEEAAAVIMQKNLRGIAARRKTIRELKAADTGGFIRVFVRVRPLGEGRGERGQRVSVDSRNGKINIRSVRESAGGGSSNESNVFASLMFTKLLVF